MRAKIVEETSHIDELLTALKFLTEMEIEIGIFSDDFKNSNGDLTVYGKAVVNEYGAEIIAANGNVIRIPERSYIRASFDDNKKQIYNSVEDMLDDVLNGELTTKEMAAIIGENGVRMIRNHILAGVEPANAPATLENKKGDLPLVDHGDLLKSLDWRIVKR